MAQFFFRNCLQSSQIDLDHLHINSLKTIKKGENEFSLLQDEFIAMTKRLEIEKKSLIQMKENEKFKLEELVKIRTVELQKANQELDLIAYKIFQVRSKTFPMPQNY